MSQITAPAFKNRQLPKLPDYPTIARKQKKAQIKQKAQRLKALRLFKIVAEAPILSMHKTRPAPAVLMQRARKALKRRAAKRFIKGQLHVTLGLHVTI